MARRSTLLATVLLLTAAGLWGVSEGQQDPPPVCFLPQESGPCRAFFPAYYYDPLTRSCDCFVYGGCQGNANRFDNVLECMLSCNVDPALQFETDSCKQLFGPPQRLPPPPPPAAALPDPGVAPPAPAPPPQSIPAPPPPPLVPEEQPDGGLGFDSSLTVTIDGPDGPKTIYIGQPVSVKRS